jgi:uncharacterized protein YjbI with pentapeptide repeats
MRANLRGTNINEADLWPANLREADLRDADLSGGATGRRGPQRGEPPASNLIDARLDYANLTDAHLWETQRGGWSIKNVICERAFWDREAKELTEYAEREFERIYAEKPGIVLRYPGGISPMDLLALPLVVERLQVEHPGSMLSDQLGAE